MDELARLHRKLVDARDWAALLRLAFVFQIDELLEAACTIVSVREADFGEPYLAVASWLKDYPPEPGEVLPVLPAEVLGPLPVNERSTLEFLVAFHHDLLELAKMEREGWDFSRLMGPESLMTMPARLARGLGDEALEAKVMEVGGLFFAKDLHHTGNAALAKLGVECWRQIAAKWSSLVRADSDIYLGFAAGALGVLGTLETVACDYPAAVKTLREALRLLERTEATSPGEFEPLRASWLHALSLAEAQLHLADEPLAHSREAVRLLKARLGPDATEQDRMNVALALIRLSQTESNMGAAGAAREHMAAAMALVGAVFPPDYPDRPASLVATLCTFADAERAWDNLGAAKRYWNEAVNLGEAWREKSRGFYLPALSRALVGLGRVALDEERPAEALAFFRRAEPDLLAMKEFNRTSVRTQLAELLLFKGRAEMKLGNLSVARQTQEQAASYLDLRSDGAAGPMIFTELALLALRLGEGSGQPDHVQAHQYFARACREAESWRSIYATAERRSQVQAEMGHFFEGHLRHSLLWWTRAPEVQKAAILREAFRTAEAGRSRRLLDQLAASGGWQPRRIPPQFVAEIRRFDAILRELRQRRAAAADEPLATGWALPTCTDDGEAEERDCEEQRAALIARYLREHPGACLEPGVAVQDAEAIFKLIPTDVPTAFVEFVMEEDLACAFVLLADHPIAVVEYDPELTRALNILTETWPNTLEEYDRVVASSQDSDAIAFAEILGGQVMGKLFDAIGPALLQPLLCLLRAHAITRVVIAPHRVLHLLPLHACTLWEGGGQALGDQVEVSYAPSFSLLHQVVRAGDAREGRHAHSLLVLEDPTRDTFAGQLFFPRYEAAAMDRQFAAHSELDIQRVSGKAVTHDSLVAASLEARVLHYTGHGGFDQESPSLSQLTLAGHPVTVTDIYTAVNLQDNDLTFLNCCESGRLNVDELDNFQNFTTAFLCAGARCVISTLWSVHDLPSALLVDEFYRQVLAGLAPAAALRTAQRHLRSLEHGTSLNKAIVQLMPGVSVGLENEPLADALEQAAEYVRVTGRERPFDSPVYWAAFACHGAGFYPVRLGERA